MIEDLKERTKNTFSTASILVDEYLNKHKKPEQYFFLQFRPDPTISAFELTQVMMLSNTVFAMYGVVVTPLNTFFVSADIYYNMLPASLVQKHFLFMQSATIDLTDAYDTINNSVK